MIRNLILITFALIIRIHHGYGLDNRGCDDGFECVDRESCDYLFSAGVYDETDVSQRVMVQCSGIEVCCPIPACGLRIIDMVGLKSVGSAKTREGEFPWMVAIFQENGRAQFTYQCGGSLISQSVILTAAHCVENASPNTLKIRVGVHNIEDNNPTYVDISEIVRHEMYYKAGLHNDIALLILKKQLKKGIHVNTICLPDVNTNLDTNKCLVAGWGSSRSNIVNNLLRKIDLPIVPNNVCRNLFRERIKSNVFRLHASFICAGGEDGIETYQGDGGSPLMCPSMTNNNKYYQVGVVAGGINCGQGNVPDLYARVSHLREWINNEIDRRFLYSVDSE